MKKFVHPTLAGFYVVMLGIIYVAEIAPKWSYFGYELVWRPGALMLGLISVFAFSFLLPTKFTTRAFLLSAILYAFIFPSCVYFALGGKSFEYFVAVSVSFIVILTFSAIPVSRINLAKLSNRQFSVLIVLGVTILLALIVLFGGIGSFSLSIFDVYQFRKESAEALPSVFSYIISPATKILVPALAVIAIIRENRSLLILSIFFATLFFGLNHHKSMLVAPIAVLVLFSYLRNSESSYKVTFLFGALALFSLIEVSMMQWVMESENPAMFTSLIIRRVLFVPPLLDSAYIEFFEENDLYYWSMSKFGFGLITPPYDVSAPFVIGREVFGSSEMSANTGMIGSGYSNAGMLGVVFYAMLVGLLLSFLDAYGKKSGHAVVSAISFVTVQVIVTSTDFSTAVLSHGLIFLMMLVMLSPRNLPIIAPMPSR